MKMELIEGSETSAISIVTPGNYPKENILQQTSKLGSFTLALKLKKKNYLTKKISAMHFEN